jgi:hypothetical protein
MLFDVAVEVRQFITASSTVPALLMAASQMRPGVLLANPRVEEVGMVTERAEVTLIAE